LGYLKLKYVFIQSKNRNKKVNKAIAKKKKKRNRKPFNHSVALKAEISFQISRKEIWVEPDSMREKCC